MTVYLGTDIVYIPRIQAALDRFGQRFLLRVYTRAEQEHCTAKTNQPRTTATRYAGRWAAKEAIAKALGTGFRGISYTEIEIQPLPNGAPHVCLYGKAAEVAANWGNCCWQVSISHDEDYCMATAIALCQPLINTAATAPVSASPLPCT